MNKKLTRSLMAITLCFALAPVEMQSQEEHWKMFGVSERSGDWQRLQLEEWLEHRLGESLAKVLDESKFEVVVRARFRVERKKTVVKNVTLDKFGTVAQIVQKQRSKPANGLFDQVEKLHVTLVTDETVNAETVDALRVMIMNKVPLIDPSRIEINSFGIKAPGLSVTDWIREFRPFVGGLILLAFFFLGLFYIMQRVRFHGEFKLAPHVPRRKRPVPRLQGRSESDWGYPFLPATPIEKMDEYAYLEDHREDRVEYESSATPDAGWEVNSVPKSEEALQDEPGVRDDVEKQYPVDDRQFKNVLASTRTNLNLRKIRSAFLTLTVEECIAIAKTDVPLAAVMEMLLPAEKAAQVMSAIPGSQRRKIVDQHLKFDESQVSAQADKLIDVIQSYRGQVSKNPDLKLDNLDSIAVYIDQVGPAAEEVVFDSLIGMGKVDMLEKVARYKVPAAVVPGLPPWFLKACLFKLNFQDRVEFLLTCHPKLKEVLLEEVRSSDRNAFEALSKSMKHQESARRKSAVKLNSDRLMVKFLKHVRAGAHANEDLSGHVVTAVDKWLAERTHGLVGSGGKRKKSA